MNNVESREEKMVKALEALGGTLWEKYDKKRVYFNWEKIADIVHFYYDNPSYGEYKDFSLKGSRLSNYKGRIYLSELRELKVFYDFSDSNFHYTRGSDFGKEAVAGLKSEVAWYFKTHGEIKADELEGFRDALKEDVHTVLSGDKINMEKYSDMIVDYNKKYSLSLYCYFIDDVVRYVLNVAKTIKEEHLLDDTEEYERSLALGKGEVEFIDSLICGLIDGICDEGVMTPLKDKAFELRGFNTDMESLYNLLKRLAYTTGSVEQFMKSMETLGVQTEAEEVIERNM